MSWVELYVLYALNKGCTSVAVLGTVTALLDVSIQGPGGHVSVASAGGPCTGCDMCRFYLVLHPTDMRSPGNTQLLMHEA